MTGDALVVDDDPVSRAVLAHLVTKTGYEVYEADGPDHARELLQDTTFDVVFSDYRMPDEDGLSLFRSLTHLEPRPRFVLVSGVVELPSPDLTELGVDAVLPKPVMTRAVVECMETLGLPRARP
ncbi:response regulator [Microbacterium xanthum]|uniref:response regulator n=1 Tax=Microbacterium xanthum TaxID=3079794 RepID=UPI002AD20AEE|nr:MULTISPECIES: response regulator [unclassified Microbacterium]MDZ8171549.1 response regulator [Microbacterium sp. KSW-48]MDZ8200412.1 response regulator [Microbacterium sp. SSW1-59]